MIVSKVLNVIVLSISCGFSLIRLPELGGKMDTFSYFCCELAEQI